MKKASAIPLVISLFFSYYSSFSLAAEPLPDAASLGLENLTNDLSRQQLFVKILGSDLSRKMEYDTFAVKKYFKFPTDVSYDSVLNQPRPSSLFGVDISHHNDKDFPIELLAKNKSVFLYMKSSQGTRYVDPEFAGFWQRAGATERGVKLHRGAYHFLSSGTPADDAETWGRKQAMTFVKIIKANGGLRATDMPPAVDVEWDVDSSTGKDRWKKRKPAEIITMIKAFTAQVEADLGRKPVIYTARAWWKDAVGGENSFAQVADHKLWLADYSNQAQASETPRSINQTKWAIWQFTDAAQLNLGSSKKFDASIYKGPIAEFYTTLGVQEF
ncbi:hypothetical protein K6716_16135 [Escherichia marmotae]|uniref:glycoside hydrolase family 25 protein n=1 Tax=Escherichia ruysiae TaxID=2608867 RepID=UPI001C9AD9D5|nr:hypothetical protein [Escherichia ruysiae]MBY7360910.1 hypothetical protein [Escherichia ruysiae]MBY7621166.1 hypothetical protein [Escherichia marmotae]